MRGSNRPGASGRAQRGRSSGRQEDEAENKDQREVLWQTLVALDDAGERALSQGTGADLCQRSLIAGAHMGVPFCVLTREQRIHAIRPAPPWVRCSIETPQVVSFKGDSGILTYRTKAYRAGQKPLSALTTVVFVKENRDW